MCGRVLCLGVFGVVGAQVPEQRHLRGAGSTPWCWASTCTPVLLGTARFCSAQSRLRQDGEVCEDVGWVLAAGGVA